MTATAATPPGDVGDARAELAELFLHGDGLEIGALHLPTTLPLGSQARYVDRMSIADLREHYPELADLDLTPVDVIDDGERLVTVEPGSVDFIVANHFLEHCQDPIRTIQTHLSKLRPGGTLFYAVPDMRYTFDFRRPRTPLQHVIADHEHGPEHSRSEHYSEWARLIYNDEPPSDDEARAAAKRLEAEDYSIHFHVWTQADLAELMFHIHEQLGNFEVEAIRRRNIENIVVLRKHGERLSTRTALRSATSWADLDVRGRTSVPLAGLRARLDGGSAIAEWSTRPDGLEGRAWIISTEHPVAVPLVLDGPLGLEARAQLLPHDWRDATGGVDAWAAAVCTDGRREQLWTATLTPATDPGGVPIDCLIPADTVELQFGISKRGPLTDRSIARLAIIEPYLADPRADGAGSLESRSVAPPSMPAVPEDGPLISVLCPVHDPEPYMLQEAIASVAAQTYGNWELVLCDDGSRSPEIIAMLDRHAAEEERVRLTRRPEAGGISVATNAALAQATGDYVALLDHDDTLDPHALAHIAGLIGSDPTLDMVYTDEGVLTDDRITAYHLKPDWSPELLEVAMYTTHFGVYRRSLADALGGFSSTYDGTQDYDFVLRLSDETDRIAHVPELLYHWRAHASSTAGGEQAKPYAYTAQPGAIAAHLRRRGVDAEVQHGPAPGLHRIVHRVAPDLGVTIALAVPNADGLYEAAVSWTSQPHPSWRVIISAPADHLPQVVQALVGGGVAAQRITTVVTEPGHGPAGALDAAARRAQTEHVLLLRTPLLGLSHDWLGRLLGYSARGGIAAAGAVVLSHDGRIANSGVAVPDRLPQSLVHGRDGAAAPSAAMNVTALDGALITPTPTLHALGGLDPDAGSLVLIDYCIRAADDRAERSVLVPDVRLRTLGPDTETNDLPRLWQLGRRFAASHDHDPYYNPQYHRDRADFHVRDYRETPR
jgi:predicted SAM-dependent methyltransferase